MSEPFIAEIRMVSFNFAPRFWAHCDGQLLPIAQNQALFSLLGTTYGGDGRTNFALPDLRGRVPIHAGDSSTGVVRSRWGRRAARRRTRSLRTRCPRTAMPVRRSTRPGPAAQAH